MENSTNSFSEKLIRIMKGVVISFLISIVLLFILAILLTYTGVQENVIKPTVIIISFISILIGSSISAIHIKKNGLINGGIIGLMYILVLYILSSTIDSNFNLNISSMIMFLISILAGMLGGILGINMK